jgi:thymidine kinase
MGKVDKGVGCGVVGCKNPAERSLSREDIGGSGLSVGGEGRRVYLCRDHYKAWKKATKSSRSLERSRW